MTPTVYWTGTILALLGTIIGIITVWQVPTNLVGAGMCFSIVIWAMISSEHDRSLEQDETEAES
jgi:hypothetical protein